MVTQILSFVTWREFTTSFSIKIEINKISSNLIKTTSFLSEVSTAARLTLVACVYYTISRRNSSSENAPLSAVRRLSFAVFTKNVASFCKKSIDNPARVWYNKITVRVKPSDGQPKKLKNNRLSFPRKGGYFFMVTQILSFVTRKDFTQPAFTRNSSNISSILIKITSFLSEVLTAFGLHPHCLRSLYHISTIFVKRKRTALRRSAESFFIVCTFFQICTSCRFVHVASLPQLNACKTSASVAEGNAFRNVCSVLSTSCGVPVIRSIKNPP